MTSTETVLKGDVELLDMIEMSEPGNAERLRAIAKGTIHYVDTWNTWIVFRDGKWEIDGGGVGLQGIAKLVPKSLFTMATTLKGEDQKDYKELHIAWARKSNTEPQLKRMATLARDLPGVRITSDELDNKPWLLNLINGTFDFVTNTFRDHDPGDLLTKMATTRYEPSAVCPLWLKSLERWQPDAEVRRFLQSITGSGLIGQPVQHLFMNVGGGRNGKGTYYKHVQNILGDYAGTAPEDMLIETKWKVHDEEKARLRGCRFLVAPETQAGDRLDESGIKNMTGGDMIHARHLYGRPFDFMPTHTAFLHTNHEPHIRGTDPGIWSRVIKIPWLVTIPDAERDTSIDQKLDLEHSGILNWLIEGCQQWLKDKGKVVKPKAIADATEGYRAEQDTIGRFLLDCMDTMVFDSAQGPQGTLDYIPAAILRKHYESWCQQEGTKPWTAASTGKELRHQGWVPDQVKINSVKVRVWKYKNSQSAGTTKLSDQDLSSSVPSVPSLSILNPIVKIEKRESNEEVNIESADPNGTDGTDWIETDLEIHHREWLYDHGYPVPPTDEEIEAYQRQQEEEYEHPYDVAPEPPEPEEE